MCLLVPALSTTYTIGVLGWATTNETEADFLAMQQAVSAVNSDTTLLGSDTLAVDIRKHVDDALMWQNTIAFISPSPTPVVGIIGVYLSSDTQKIYPTAAAFSKNLMSYGAESSVFSDKTVYPFFTRASLNNDIIAKATVGFMQAMSWPGFSVIFRDDVWGRDVNTKLYEGAAQRTIKIYGAEAQVPSSDAAVADSIESIRIATGSSVFVLVVFGDALKNAITAAYDGIYQRDPRESALDGFGFVCASTVTRSWLTGSFQTKARGFIFIEPQYSTAAFTAWSEAQLAGTGSSYSGQAWDTIFAFAHAIQNLLQAGRDPLLVGAGEVAAALRNVSFDSIPFGSKFRLDHATGDRILNMTYVNVHGGGAVVAIGGYNTISDQAIVDSSRMVNPSRTCNSSASDEPPPGGCYQRLLGTPSIIRVAALLSTNRSGLYRDIGGFHAMRMAAEAVTTQSEILYGRSVQIAPYYYSTQSELFQMATALLSDPLVVAVVGPQTSEDTLQVSPFLGANAAHMPHLIFSATSTTLSDTGKFPHIVRVCASDALTMRAIGEILKRVELQWYATIRDNSVYGNSGQSMLAEYVSSDLARFLTIPAEGTP